MLMFVIGEFTEVSKGMTDNRWNVRQIDPLIPELKDFHCPNCLSNNCLAKGSVFIRCNNCYQLLSEKEIIECKIDN